MNAQVRDRSRGDEKKLTKAILGIEIVEGRQSLLGYQFDATKAFIKGDFPKLGFPMILTKPALCDMVCGIK